MRFIQPAEKRCTGPLPSVYLKSSATLLSRNYVVKERSKLPYNINSNQECRSILKVWFLISLRVIGVSFFWLAVSPLEKSLFTKQKRVIFLFSQQPAVRWTALILWVEGEGREEGVILAFWAVECYAIVLRAFLEYFRAYLSIGEHYWNSEIVKCKKC